MKLFTIYLGGGALVYEHTPNFLEPMAEESMRRLQNYLWSRTPLTIPFISLALLDDILQLR